MREKRCDECPAGVYLLPMAGAGAAFHPVDMIEVSPPMTGLLAFNPESGRAVVLRQEDVVSGRAARWVEEGRVRIFRSHFATCAGASAVRARPRPGQERLDV
jgi:hypothetical protein